MSATLLKILDYVERTVTDLGFAVSRENLDATGTGIGRLRGFFECLKMLLPVEFTNKSLDDFNRHLSFMEKFFGEGNFEWIIKNLSDIKDFDLPHMKQDLLRLVEKARAVQESPLLPSNRVFIVHGRDYESVKELKTMLVELGLNPIVLHEQPSKGRTVVEKLEDYSDVGYAFAILTPDDGGLSSEEVMKLFSGAVGKDKVTVDDLKSLFENDEASAAITMIQFFSLIKQRAWQNVVMEFGYFWGLLGRDRVCCLYKGDIELPSDMHGIVYIPFKNSVNEARSMIVKELKAAGYQIEDK